MTTNERVCEIYTRLRQELEDDFSDRFRTGAANQAVVKRQSQLLSIERAPMVKNLSRHWQRGDQKWPG